MLQLNNYLPGSEDGDNYRKSIYLIILWFSVTLAVAFLFSVAVIWGDLNHDEGWYLYGASLLKEGKLPYIDFASTQGPIIYYFFASFYNFVSKFGLTGARILNGIVGLFACYFASVITVLILKYGDRSRTEINLFAGLLSFVLSSLGPYQAYFLTVVKTYSIGAFLLALLFISAIKAEILAICSIYRGMLWSFIAGVCCASVIACRISTSIIAIILPLTWLVKETGLSNIRHRLYMVTAFLTGLIGGIMCIFLPYIIFSPSQLYFWLIKYHAARSVELTSWIGYRIGAIARIIRWNLLPISIITAGWILRNFIKNIPCIKLKTECAIWWSLLGITLIHMTAPFPYDDYQVIIMPIFASLAVLFFFRVSFPFLYKERVLFCLSFSVILLVFSYCLASPVLESWFVKERNLVWWPLRKIPRLIQLRYVADYIKKYISYGGDTILTQDVYLAVETGMRVPHGLEMGPFSYFPNLSTDEAIRYNVVNKDKLLELIHMCPAKIAAISDYSFAIASPMITPVPEHIRKEFMDAILSRYKLKSIIRDFGQGGTELKIFVEE